MKKMHLLTVMLSITGTLLYLSYEQPKIETIASNDSSNTVIQPKEINANQFNTASIDRPDEIQAILTTPTVLPIKQNIEIEKKSMDNSKIVLIENYTTDEKGNQIAISFSPEQEGNVGTENEDGEGIAVEFHPEQLIASNTTSTLPFEESYISGVDGDYAHPITLENTSGESEANPIMLEENYLATANGDYAHPITLENTSSGSEANPISLTESTGNSDSAVPFAP